MATRYIALTNTTTFNGRLVTWNHIINPSNLFTFGEKGEFLQIDGVSLFITRRDYYLCQMTGTVDWRRLERSKGSVHDWYEAIYYEVDRGVYKYFGTAGNHRTECRRREAVKQCKSMDESSRVEYIKSIGALFYKECN